MKNFGIALVLTIATSAGCQSAAWESADVATDASPFAEATFRPLGDFDVAGSESYKGHNADAVSARLDLLDVVMDRVDEIRAVLNAGGSWYARQQQIMEIMRAPDVSEPEAWFVDQIGSSIVLERLTRPVARDRRTHAEKKAAIPFVNVLVGRKSPNAPLIADALEATWDLWSPESARAIALISAQNAGAYLESCRSCAVPKSESSVVAFDRESRFIAEGRVRLLQLAKSGGAVAKP